MKIHRFYEDQDLPLGATVELGPETASHVGRVLRLKPEDAITLFNGQGGEYKAMLREVSKKNVRVEVLEHCEENRQSPLKVQLGQVLSKGQRMDFAIQKATELGVHQITALSSERSEVRLQADRVEKKLSHWRKIAIGACEQSGRNLLPEISAPVSLSSWMQCVEADVKLILDGSGESVLHCGEKVNSCAVVIGPEGGFSEAELGEATDMGFLAARLGPRTLRTESAPLAVLSVLQYLYGDLR